MNKIIHKYYFCYLVFLAFYKYYITLYLDFHVFSVHFLFYFVVMVLAITSGHLFFLSQYFPTHLWLVCDTSCPIYTLIFPLTLCQVTFTLVCNLPQLFSFYLRALFLLLPGLMGFNFFMLLLPLLTVFDL